ncbi:MAG: alpha/beta fold hydrolase [Saprospiraceae bacterium]|nr:alpha/beta fold hydrolase [Saprospiraceae bacterium]
MPLVPSSYNPNFLLSKSAHFQTIYPSIFRKLKKNFTRERLNTPDDDILDIEWLKSSKVNNKLIIGLHGLESSALAPYVANTLCYFNENGWDAISMHNRGCSGELNHKPHAYHSGYTGDLAFLIDHVASLYPNYETIVLVGYSMGGNLMLKYIGEKSNKLLPNIKTAVAISVPFDLDECGKQISKWYNMLYLWNFLLPMKQKLKDKLKIYPDFVNWDDIKHARNFEQFDNAYTAPIYGFANAQDYYEQASCKNYIDRIEIPFLVVNALNDPILTKSCYPYEKAAQSNNFYLETPKYGGHLGFIQKSTEGYYWHDARIFDFVTNTIH